MTLQDMIKALNLLIDDVAETSDAVLLFNMGKNKMATAVGAKFPDITANINDTFVFDEKYHEVPILYAAAKIKEQDSSIAEAQNFMIQFNDSLKEFVENYEVLPRYRDDRLSQQFTGVANQLSYKITKIGYDPSTSDLKVYVNDSLRTDVTVNADRTFSFPSTAAPASGDAITAIWEEHVDIVEPPYSWWSW